MENKNGSYVDKFFAHLEEMCRNTIHFSQHDLVAEFYTWMQDQNLIKDWRTIDKERAGRIRAASYRNNQESERLGLSK